MNDIFQCGDSGALVAYLYDECTPDEQELIGTHIKRCATCASEIDALRATRRTLAAWTPPDLALGFQITRSDVAPVTGGPVFNGPAKVLEPKIVWWRAPLPAWAQAAAALLIFAAGLSLGIARNGSSGQTTMPQTVAIVPSESRDAAATVSRDDLAQLEQRIKQEMAQMRTASAVPVSARGDDQALMREVRALIEQSNEEQRRDFTRRMVDLAGSIETQRRVDLANVRQSVGQLQGVVGTEFRQQREVNERFNSLLINVSERAR